MNHQPNPNDYLTYTGLVSKTEAMNLLGQLLPDADPAIVQAYVEHQLASAAHIINRNFIQPLQSQVTLGGRALLLLRQEFPEYSDAELDQLAFDLIKNTIETMKATTEQTAANSTESVTTERPTNNSGRPRAKSK